MSYKRMLALCTLLSSSFVAHAAFWAPHIGVDYKYWGLEPTESAIGSSAINPVGAVGNGYEDVFPRISNAYNVYIGSRINGYFGIDIGYEQSLLGQKSHTFGPISPDVGFGEIYFVNPEAQYDATNITIRMHDLHLDLNFYWEVMRRLEIVFMAGVAFVHIQSHINHLTDGVWAPFTSETEMKTMGRIGIGAQYNFLPCLGVRMLFNWEPDSRINFVGLDQDFNYFSIHPYKTSTMVNIGVVYSFSNPRRHPTPVDTSRQWEY